MAPLPILAPGWGEHPPPPSHSYAAYTCTDRLAGRHHQYSYMPIHFASVYMRKQNIHSLPGTAPSASSCDCVSSWPLGTAI